MNDRTYFTAASLIVLLALVIGTAAGFVAAQWLRPPAKYYFSHIQWKTGRDVLLRGDTQTGKVWYSCFENWMEIPE